MLDVQSVILLFMGEPNASSASSGTSRHSPTVIVDMQMYPNPKRAPDFHVSSSRVDQSIVHIPTTAEMIFHNPCRTSHGESILSWTAGKGRR